MNKQSKKDKEGTGAKEPDDGDLVRQVLTLYADVWLMHWSIERVEKAVVRISDVPLGIQLKLLSSPARDAVNALLTKLEQAVQIRSEGGQP